MDALVISIETPTETLNHLASHGFNSKLMKGVVGKKLDENYIRNVFSPLAYKMYRGYGKVDDAFIKKKGAIGCYLSHVNAWTKVVRENKPYFIFEDDARIKNMDKIMENVGKHDFVHLSASWMPSYAWTLGKKGVHTIDGGCFRSHAYWITPKAASFLIRHAFPMEQVVDLYFSHVMSQHKDKIDAVAVLPSPVGISGRPTMIGEGLWFKPLLPNGNMFYIVFIVLFLTFFIVMCWSLSKQHRSCIKK